MARWAAKALCANMTETRTPPAITDHQRVGR